MAQPTPEKILAIIDDHDRARKKQRNKNVFIYLCLCLAIIGVVAHSFISTFRLDGVAVLTILDNVFRLFQQPEHTFHNLFSPYTSDIFFKTQILLAII